MKTKLDIFILRGGIQTELVDSFSHNNCNVILFSTIDEMLASSVSSPELIVLDEPELTLEKQRVQIKLDYRFPMSEIIYLSSDDTLPVKGKYSINEKLYLPERVVFCVSSAVSPGLRDNIQK